MAKLEQAKAIAAQSKRAEHNAERKLLKLKAQIQADALQTELLQTKRMSLMPVEERLQELLNRQAELQCEIESLKATNAELQIQIQDGEKALQAKACQLELAIKDKLGMEVQLYQARSQLNRGKMGKK